MCRFSKMDLINTKFINIVYHVYNGYGCGFLRTVIVRRSIDVHCVFRLRMINRVMQTTLSWHITRIKKMTASKHVRHRFRGRDGVPVGRLTCQKLLQHQESAGVTTIAGALWLYASFVGPFQDKSQTNSSKWGCVSVKINGQCSLFITHCCPLRQLIRDGRG